MHNPQHKRQPARWLPALAAAFTLLAGCVAQDPVSRGAGNFQTYCAGCHGTDARGFGQTSRMAPPDLTLLSRHNNGTFPLIRVLDKVEGYSRGIGGDGGDMPELGFLMEGRLVRIDAGDGATRPVPQALADMVRYIRAIQR